MPEPTELTIDDYVRRLHAEAESFGTRWRANQVLDPEAWPATMNVAEWDEQFIADTM